MEWSHEYAVGVNSIDEAHRRLFMIVKKINELVNYGADNKNRFACQEGMKFLKNYVALHFSEEEAYMRSIDYQGYEQHKAIHDSMKNQTLPMVERELMESGYSAESVRHFVGICTGCLVSHIMIEDRAITDISVRQLVMPCETGILALAESVSKLVPYVFGINARIMSTHYTGWDIGDVICCEMIYVNEEEANEELHIIYMLEERLAAGVSSRVLGEAGLQINHFLFSAIEEINQTLLSQEGTWLGLQRTYGKFRRHLISPEQASGLYQTRRPQHSVLFRTELGYFSFALYETANAADPTKAFAVL